MSEKKPTLKEIPERIVNPQNGKEFIRGRFLGKGGFARCYELKDVSTGDTYAGKIVSKAMLQRKSQKDKMAQEVSIHRALSHPHIVRLEGYFEDSDNVYILLELCSRRSLMELHKRRRAVTEPEARYFTMQVVEACEYLHKRRIIHRDLKLGNLFLNDNMQLKVGDFGLATILDYDGERKKTLCGTPNYIAPEMLDKKGHSYEVDIWAIGCVLYTLLVGQPPFETTSLKETYHKIKNNEYSFPNRTNKDAMFLIERLLAADPAQRPKISEICKFDFFVRGYMPPRLPTSCLTMAPKFTQAQLNFDREMQLAGSVSTFLRHDRQTPLPLSARHLPTVPETRALSPKRAPAEEHVGQGDSPLQADEYLKELHRQIGALVSKRIIERAFEQEDKTEDPAAMPVFWVSKWVDYSDKYGLGYQLCDNSVGVLFNDSTKIIVDAAGKQVMYTDRENKEFYYETTGTNPESLNKKFTLLRYFSNYMNENLQKAGAGVTVREGDELARLPCLRVWFRTNSAIIMHLSNGTVQINFFKDHAKLILCPLMAAVSYIDQDRNFRVLKFELIEKFGCCKEFFTRLKYAFTMVERLMGCGSKGQISGSNMKGLSRTGSQSTAVRRLD